MCGQHAHTWCGAEMVCATSNDLLRCLTAGPWRPFYPGQLEPTLVSSNPPPPFAPVSPGLLLCGSLSYSLPPILSCSPLLFLSCRSSLFLSHCALPSLSLCFSLPLSRAQKGGSGCSVHLYPPRGSNHPPRDRRGVVYPLSHDDRVSAPCAPLFFSFVSPPIMRIFFRMGVCSAACRGTARRPRVPGPPV